MTNRRFGVVLVASLALASPGHGALAQTGRSPAPAAKEPAPPPEPPPPPYEPQLLKLAEIIGSLAFLRTLCGAADAQGWRDRMTALLEAEGRTPLRRERLTGAFNRGFRAYAVTHRVCTDGTQEASARLAAEGERLARTLAGRFGG
ncbi:MAG: TIGR02301 family protein [Bosea sp. (in: a-proteobacteria)]